MEIALLLLLVLNLLLGIGLLGLLLLRGRGEAVVPELRLAFQQQRTELQQTVSGGQQQTDAHLRELRTTLEQRFDVLRGENETKLEQMRAAVDDKLQHTLKTSLDANAERIRELTELHAQKQLDLRKTLTEELEKLRKDNEAKLEQMRVTVDEKLQGTLEKRLGESFALVSDRLEQVQKGLGEMQTLASDVGGLKRVRAHEGSLRLVVSLRPDGTIRTLRLRGRAPDYHLRLDVRALFTPTRYDTIEPPGGGFVFDRGLLGTEM